MIVIVVTVLPVVIANLWGVALWLEGMSVREMERDIERRLVRVRMARLEAAVATFSE